MDTYLPSDIEVIRVLNGWIVRPMPGLLDQRPPVNRSEVRVFETEERLFAFLTRVGQVYPVED